MCVMTSQDYVSLAAFLGAAYGGYLVVTFLREAIKCLRLIQKGLKP